MSRTPVLALAILLKKITRKSMLAKRFRSKKAKYHDIGSATSCSAQEDKTSYVFPVEKRRVVSLINEPHYTLESDNHALSTPAIKENNDIVVRDFAYPNTSPLHHGRYEHSLALSLSDSGFTGCNARVLYNYVPKTEQELAMTEGDVIWIQYRISPGYFVADIQDETGLVPESAVELIVP